MNRFVFPSLCLLVWFSCAPLARALDERPLAQWDFDEASGGVAHDAASGVDDPITGTCLRVPGVAGGALRMDGVTSTITRAAARAPQPGRGLTVETCAVVHAYPWNLVPIVDHRRKEEAGYFFGLDAEGRLGLQVAVQGKWQSLFSVEPLPLGRWVHLAGTYDPAVGMTLYVDGKAVGRRALQGAMTLAAGENLLIGRTRAALVPTNAIHPLFPVWYSFDGILDEVRIYDGALPEAGVWERFTHVVLPGGNPLPPAVLPAGPPGKGRFGGFYTTLRYDPLWEAPRRVGPDTDVVVRFDELPVRLVFWQGTSYTGDWVSENNKWYTDEFVETMENKGGGDFEPMSDKQNRYSHVRILESNDARTVVHWRYAQSECEQYLCADPEPLSGWTDWADEYFTVYPDGVAVRKQVAWTTNLKAMHEFQESIIIHGAGARPEDDIEPVALAIANMDGQTAAYTWADRPPRGVDPLPHPNIQVVNLKSTWKPFQIVPPAHASIKPYTGEKTRAMFEWWNHWPVTPVASSGISAVAADRPSHSSLSHIFWDPVATSSDSITKVMLAGMTTKPAAELVPLARSWLTAPALTLDGEGFTSQGYDQTERAFVMTRLASASASSSPDRLQAQLQASESSPLNNPAFVIHGWGGAEPLLTVDGKPVARGASFRYGFVPHLEGDDLVIWLRLTAAAPVRLQISAAVGR